MVTWFSGGSGGGVASTSGVVGSGGGVTGVVGSVAAGGCSVVVGVSGVLGLLVPEEVLSATGGDDVSGGDDAEVPELGLGVGFELKKFRIHCKNSLNDIPYLHVYKDILIY